MPNNQDQPQPRGVSPQPAPGVPPHLADLRVQPADESTWQTLKRNLTPQIDTSRSVLGPGHQSDSEDSPQQLGEQQYRESFGSPLEQAYGKLKGILAQHEQYLSDKVLKPFRQGLDNMADDLQEAAGTGHTKSGGQITPMTRVLLGGAGTALRAVPIGKDVKETAARLVVPPELGPEGKALSKEVSGAEKVEPVYAYRTRDVGEQGIPADPRSHAHATMSEAEARSYIESRGKVQGKPQETVRFDLNRVKPEDYERKTGPSGNDWIKLKKAVPEEAVEKTQPPKTANTEAASKLPPQPRLPDTGTHAAIKTNDGGIYYDDAPEKQRTHIMLAKDLGIPAERVVSGGWLKDGEYEGSERSDAGRWGDQARAKQRVEANRAEELSNETLYHGSPDISKIDQLKPGTKGGYFGDGVYLSRDPNVARRFTKLESMNPTLERNADGSFTDINTGKRVPGGSPGVLKTTLNDARLKHFTIEEMEAEVEKFRQPNGVIDLDAARNAVAAKYAKQGYDGFDVPASKNFDEPQVVIFPSSAKKLDAVSPASGEPAPTTKTPEAKARERAANLKGLGIGLTEMDAADARNWVGYTGKEKALKVYRGVDDSSHAIGAGDFVTTSKESAHNYGQHVQEIEVAPEELRYVRGHKDGDPRLLDQGGQTELIYAPSAKKEINQKATELGKKAAPAKKPPKPIAWAPPQGFRNGLPIEVSS